MGLITPAHCPSLTLPTTYVWKKLKRMHLADSTENVNWNEAREMYLVFVSFHWKPWRKIIFPVHLSSTDALSSSDFAIRLLALFFLKKFCTSGNYSDDGLSLFRFTAFHDQMMFLPSVFSPLSNWLGFGPCFPCLHLVLFFLAVSNCWLRRNFLLAQNFFVFWHAQNFPLARSQNFACCHKLPQPFDWTTRPSHLLYNFFAISAAPHPSHQPWFPKERPKLKVESQSGCFKGAGSLKPETETTKKTRTSIQISFYLTSSFLSERRGSVNPGIHHRNHQNHNTRIKLTLLSLFNEHFFRFWDGCF